MAVRLDEFGEMDGRGRHHVTAGKRNESVLQRASSSLTPTSLSTQQSAAATPRRAARTMSAVSADTAAAATSRSPRPPPATLPHAAAQVRRHAARTPGSLLEIG